MSLLDFPVQESAHREIDYGNALPHFWLNCFLKNQEAHIGPRVLVFDITPLQANGGFLVLLASKSSDGRIKVSKLLIKPEDYDTAGPFFRRLINASQYCLLSDKSSIIFLRTVVFSGPLEIHSKMVLFRHLIAFFLILKRGEWPSLNSVMRFFLENDGASILHWNVSTAGTLAGAHRLLSCLIQKSPGLHWVDFHNNVVLNWPYLGWYPRAGPDVPVRPIREFRDMFEGADPATLVGAKRVSLLLGMVSVEGLVVPPSEYDPGSDHGLRLALMGYICSYAAGHPVQSNNKMNMLKERLSHDERMGPLYSLLEKVAIAGTQMKVAALSKDIFKRHYNESLAALYEKVFVMHHKWTLETFEGKREPPVAMGYWDVQRPYVRTKAQIRDPDILQAQPKGLKYTMQLLGPVLGVDFNMISFFHPSGRLFDDHKFSSGNSNEVYLFNAPNHPRVCGVALRQHKSLL